MNPIVVFLIRLLECLFVVGVVGSLAVFVVSLVEDLEVVMQKDEVGKISAE
jgi:hypothetical protein